MDNGLNPGYLVRGLGNGSCNEKSKSKKAIRDCGGHLKARVLSNLQSQLRKIPVIEAGKVK
jgi:hypothetical protein